MARIDLPPPEAMTPAQRAAVDEVVAGKRGKLPAPMIAWLRNPELARRGQALGELLRYDTGFEPRLCEMAILLCGRHWTSHHEWTAHRKLALEAGLDAAIVDAIAARRVPVLPDARHQAVYDVSTSLLATGRLPAPLYARGLDVLGERGLVELVGILGYYCLVSLTLNAFELGLPGHVAPELGDPDVA